MKNSRALVVLVLALLAGTIAMVLASRWLNKQASGGARVVVALRDIGIGSALDETAIELVNWPSKVRPEGAFSDPALLKDRVVRTTLTRGEPVLESKLAPVGTRGGLSSVIGPGRRAITVKVNEVVGVAGFALPGNLVDVMVNTTLGERHSSDERPMSKIVLERILVLAVAQEASRDDTKPKVVNAVTLEVTPEQAERLDLARSVGTLSLVLRNQVDQEPTLTAGIAKPDLFKVDAPVAASAAEPAASAASAPKPVKVSRSVKPRPSPPPREQVEVLRGLTRSTLEF